MRIDQLRTGQSELANRRKLAIAISFAVVERQVRMSRWMHVLAVYLTLANRGLLAVFALCEINNLRSLNRAFSPIPAAHLSKIVTIFKRALRPRYNGL